MLFLRKIVYFFLKGSLYIEIPHIWDLRRYLEGGVGEVEPSLPIWCKRTFFQKKKKKIKIVDFVKYCVMELTYIVMIVGWYSFFVFFFVVRRKKKKKKTMC